MDTSVEISLLNSAIRNRVPDKQQLRCEIYRLETHLEASNNKIEDLNSKISKLETKVLELESYL